MLDDRDKILNQDGAAGPATGPAPSQRTMNRREFFRTFLGRATLAGAAGTNGDGAAARTPDGRDARGDGPLAGGIAVVDERLCVSHNGSGVCGACHTICPERNRAITLDYRDAPIVHPEHCTGCRECEEICIVRNPVAIRVVADEEGASAGDAQRAER